MNFPSLLLSFLLLASLLPSNSHAQEKPNIVFILVDDLGVTDLGCTGSTFYKTPSIDRFAASALRFTNGYSACTVCSPTRAAILTGQSPARLHLTDWIAGHERPHAKLCIPKWTKRLDPSVPNLAQALKSAGYATASIGKWHLGPPDCWPEKVGFDRNIAGADKGQPPSYFSPYKIESLPDGPKGEFLSDRLTSEALSFIEENKSRPFFLYLPHYAVHTPIMAKPEVIARYKAQADPANPHSNAAYAALIESVDDSMGRLLAKLEELQLDQKTIVIFTSDNGGVARLTSNAPFRAGKGSAYEGGVRVPLIIRWPGLTKPGSVTSTPAISYDFAPTLLAAAGITPSNPEAIDGTDLSPILKGDASFPRETLYWHYPHYHPGTATPHSAIRDKNLRLVHFYEDGRSELYDLENDPGETRDLASEAPENAASLKQKLDSWLQKVGAQMPTPNPNFDPEKDGASVKAGKH